MLRSVFVLGIEFKFLHNTGMFDKSQQDLLWQVTRPEWFHLCEIDAQRQQHTRTRVKERTLYSLSHFLILILLCHCLHAQMYTAYVDTGISKHTALPVAKKRCVATNSWGEIFTFSSFSASLNMEKSCCFLSWWDTRLLVRLSAGKTKTKRTYHFYTLIVAEWGKAWVSLIRYAT